MILLFSGTVSSFDSKRRPDAIGVWNKKGYYECSIAETGIY